MSAPKLLLITSKCPTEEISDSVAVPLGLHLLRHHLKKNGVGCDVFDHQIHSEQLCISSVEQGVYDIIGISVTHWRMESDLNFLSKLRGAAQNAGRNCLFIAGGFSATLNFRQWLECGFDLVCLGYAEETLLKVCERFAQKKSVHTWESFRDLDGVAFLDERRRLVFNRALPLSKSAFERHLFDQIMEMDLPYNEYWDFMRQRATEILTMNRRSYVIENARLFTIDRCLANCGFCCSPSFLRTAQQSNAPLIALSASQVHQLIVHHVQKYGARAFSINDDDFLVGNKIGIDRAIEICKLISASKRKGEIPEETKFSCQTRVVDFLKFDSNRKKLVNHQLLEALAKAKFHNVSLGVETFSDRLLKCLSMNKVGLTSNDYHMVLHALMDHGLYTTINLILGIPESTVEELIETIQQTLEYVEKPCQLSVANRMQSFPGSPIFGLKDYPTTGSIWTNPITNQTTYIPVYYTPHNERMAAIISQLNEAARVELENFKADNNLGDSMLIPRTAIALCTFMAVARLLGESDLLLRISNKLQQLTISLGAE